MNSRALINLKRCIHCTISNPHKLRLHYKKYVDVTDPARQNPNYFEEQAAKLPMNEHYLDALKAIWEQKVGSERDLGRKAEDNLIGNSTDYGLPDLDFEKPRLEYRRVDALKDAPETVKKIFSIDFGERSDHLATWKREYIDAVNLHKYDDSSLQSKIIWATVCIRHSSQLYDELVAAKPQRRRPRGLIRKIASLLEVRREWLQQLRDIDYEEFERVLKNLNIAYQLPKEPEHLHTRKAWSEFQLKKRISVIKEDALHKLQLELEEGREKRVQEIDAQLHNLKMEQEKIETDLAQIDIMEGKAVANTQGTYQPKLVEEMTEISLHAQLFNYPKPDKINY